MDRILRIQSFTVYASWSSSFLTEAADAAAIACLVMAGCGSVVQRGYWHACAPVPPWGMVFAMLFCIGAALVPVQGEHEGAVGLAPGGGGHTTRKAHSARPAVSGIAGWGR